MATIAWDSEADILIMAHSVQAPTDEEWRQMVDRYRATLDRHGSARAIIYSAGGSPSLKQRHLLEAVREGRTVRVAILTQSQLVRAVVTGLSWFNPEVKAFTVTDLSLAGEHLGLSAAEQRWAADRLGALKQQLGLST